MLDEREAIRRRVIAANQPLLAHQRQLMSPFERLLGESVAVDLGESPQDLHPRLVAAAATSALLVLRPDPAASHPASEAELLKPLGETLEFLRGGIAALQHRGEQPAG